MADDSVKIKNAVERATIPMIAGAI